MSQRGWAPRPPVEQPRRAGKKRCYGHKSGGQMEVPVVYWLSSQDIDTATRVQILDLTDCISHSTNTLGKGMNPIILPPAMGE